MSEAGRTPVTIPQDLMLARLAQSEQMREFFIQMWLQNPALAKQGGARVASLLAPACAQSESPDAQSETTPPRGAYYP